MHVDTFTQKLKAGLQGEEIARVYLESLGHKVGHVANDQGFCRAQDIVVNGKPVEVKLDILAAKTGNICIEHRSLETHTAPYYLYILPTFYKTTQKNLQHLVDTFPDVVEIGDDKRRGTLVPINSSFFKEAFTKL